MARRNASNMFYMFRFMKLAAPRGPAGPRFSFLRMILPCATVSVAVRPVLMRRTRHPTCDVVGLACCPLEPETLPSLVLQIAHVRLVGCRPQEGVSNQRRLEWSALPLHSRQRAPDLRATDRIRAPARGAMHPPLGQCRRAGLHDRLL